MKKLSPEKVRQGKELIAKIAKACSNAKDFKTLVYAKYDVVDLTKHPSFRKPKPELDPRKRFLELQKKSKKADIIPFEKKELSTPVPVPQKAKKIKPNPKNDKDLTIQLADLLHSEHVSGCDNMTCDINYASENGYIHWAIDLFYGSGAASPEFDKLYEQLSPAFFKEAEEERKQMVKEPHVECEHCNSITWGIDKEEAKDGNYGCSQCGKDFFGEKKA